MPERCPLCGARDHSTTELWGVKVTLCPKMPPNVVLVAPASPKEVPDA